MFNFIEWFQIHFPHLHQDMLRCSHSNDTKSLNPYHLETDCWSHTMMVCKVAELSDYDKVVQIAALLHDIGKPTVRRVNPRNGHVQFFGHEEVSAEMSHTVLALMQTKGWIDQSELYEILELIRYHGVLFKIEGIQELEKKFRHNLTFCRHLLELARCDTLGRFCVDGYNVKKYDEMLNALSIREKTEDRQNLSTQHTKIATNKSKGTIHVQ